ncbi:MAG: hypothetical protein HQK53_19560 [Oligoflexia bacterium]|nr:hypothetical protein [Oligoflexia bacterium]
MRNNHNLHNQTFAKIMAGLNRKIVFYSMLLGVIILILFGLILLDQNHKLICELAIEKIENISSPLSREITLGEDALALNIFSKVKFNFLLTWDRCYQHIF